MAFLHLAGIDRLWWIWQLQDLDNRLHIVDGYENSSTGKVPGKLTDIIDLGVLAEKRELGDLVDTTDGDFCYIYY